MFLALTSNGVAQLRIPDFVNEQLGICFSSDYYWLLLAMGAVGESERFGGFQNCVVALD